MDFDAGTEQGEPSQGNWLGEAGGTVRANHFHLTGQVADGRIEIAEGYFG